MKDHKFKMIQEFKAKRTGLPHEDLVLFADLLRSLGLQMSPSQILDAIKVLSMAGILDRRYVFEVLKCTLTRNPSEIQVFETVFPLYWSLPSDPTSISLDPPKQINVQNRSKGVGETKDLLFTRSTGSSRAPLEKGAEHATYSNTNRTGPLEKVVQPPNHSQDICERVNLLARLLKTRYSRRKMTGPKGEQIDIRSTWRKNISKGGEPFELSWFKRRKNKVKIAAICDVSTSMQPFTLFFLQFLYELSKIASVQTAIFNVKLAFITSIFKRCETFEQVLEEIAEVPTGLSGGTRIGQCLKDFHLNTQRSQAIGKQTIVIILSDGWDIGEPELLKAQMRLLKNQSSRLIWLNPYAGLRGFKPHVQGLRVSWPYIDDFLPFNDLASLDRLIHHFKK